MEYVPKVLSYGKTHAYGGTYGPVILRKMGESFA